MKCLAKRHKSKWLACHTQGWNLLKNVSSDRKEAFYLFLSLWVAARSPAAWQPPPSPIFSCIITFHSSTVLFPTYALGANSCEFNICKRRKQQQSVGEGLIVQLVVLGRLHYRIGKKDQFAFPPDDTKYEFQVSLINKCRFYANVTNSEIIYVVVMKGVRIKCSKATPFNSARKEIFIRSLDWREISAVKSDDRSDKGSTSNSEDSINRNKRETAS